MQISNKSMRMRQMKLKKKDYLKNINLMDLMEKDKLWHKD